MKSNRFLKIMAFFIAAVLFSQAAAFCGTPKRRQIFTNTAVASTASVTSVLVDVSSSGYFGLEYKATSASSTPSVKLEYEMAFDCSDTSLFVEPAAASDIEAALTAETWKIASIQPPPMGCMRIKATGDGANPADTVLNAYLFYWEP